MSKNIAVMKWLEVCPAIKELYPLFGDVKFGSKHLTKLQDVKTKQFIDGSSEGYSDYFINCFEMAVFDPQPAEYSENLADYEKAQAIIDWIFEQDESRNFPILGKKFRTNEVEAVPDEPQIAGVDEESIAKYVVCLRIHWSRAAKCN